MRDTRATPARLGLSRSFGALVEPGECATPMSTSWPESVMCKVNIVRNTGFEMLSKSFAEMTNGRNENSKTKW